MTPIAKIVKMTSFIDMISSLPDEATCRQYLESAIWGGVPTCPYCKCKESYRLTTKKVFKGMYKCRECKQRYTVTIGTMFEGSHIPLRKWFIAIYIFSLHKKGISSHQLASDLGITQKSAWFMLGRIRLAFKPAPIRFKLSGNFQCDESYFGGKNKNRHADKKVHESQGRSVKDKTPVFGIIQDGGHVHTTVVPNTQAKTLKPIISGLVENGSIIVTDEWTAYKGLAKEYDHVVVKHKEAQYVNGEFNTQSIEGFWSQMKRGLYGVYHHCSPKHLHRYCDEFSFRYNVRKQSVNDKFDFSLQHSTRLTYKQLIAN